MLVRWAVWAAVASGPLALAAAIAVPGAAAEGPAPVVASTPNVIAPPTGYAEVFVDLWLRSNASSPLAAQLRAMAPGVELPEPDADAHARAAVGRVVAVRSTPLGGRAWLVTVAAQMVVPAAHAQGAAQADAPDGARAQASPRRDAQSPEDGVPVVRYFAVPVEMVRANGSGGVPDALVVSAPPAQVAGPGALSAGPGADAYGVEVSPGALRQAVTEYLQAYLTGVGESARYLAPGVKVPAPGAVYRSVELTGLASKAEVPGQPADGAVVEVLARVKAKDVSGSWPLAYPLRLRARAGRWEVAALAPTPSSSSPLSSPSSVPSTSAGVR
ncbi:conjugal transfer protein [Streptomyces sp. NRRL B-24484]|uniref:conjugal transfer protein n=1 Tax=Streptomyces sp. NRRL B-24484 TaxID=1463833 RepID=UPI0013311DB7|nr:conjugal transfer protein [Streptomyces sp. NRRL B-24484]